ncbi:hypothetical protein B0I37DRAFT_148390 [Chaetomium sp. MPI-CAGE-AT-0009]|nr:hypothetical protein B0I37DRAFT_148390 [Chaetomium sp. MPI-CAGE-AT-0009]
MMSDSCSKAQELISEAFSRHPPNRPISKSDIAYARPFFTFVFRDTSDEPGYRQKRAAFRQLDSTTLAALGILIRLRDIRARSISVIQVLCTKAPSFIRETCWYNDVDLWKASLGVVSYNAAYMKFRKDAVIAIEKAEALQHLASPLVPSGGFDDVLGPEDHVHVAGFASRPSSGPNLVQGSAFAYWQEAETTHADVPGKQPIPAIAPPNSGNPPVSTAPIAAQPSQPTETESLSYARRTPTETQNTLPGPAIVLNCLASSGETDDASSLSFLAPVPNPPKRARYRGELHLSQYSSKNLENTNI